MENEYRIIVKPNVLSISLKYLIISGINRNTTALIIESPVTLQDDYSRQKYCKMHIPTVIVKRLIPRT